MSQRRARIAVSMGEPAGIGPELIWAAAEALRSEPIELIVTGDAAVLATARPSLASVEPDVRPSPVPCPTPTPGRADVGAAPATIAAIEAAVALAVNGEADAICTMPIAKSVLQAAGFGFPGHTEFIAHLTADLSMAGPRGPVMMLASPSLNVALATIHLPLSGVAGALSTERIVAVAKVVHAALVSDFGLAQPRLALCGLNPHAGEDGALGREEIEIIHPAAALLRSQGINCSDPRPADSLFHAEARASYDAVIAMYHDQGLIPIKTLAFWDAVNVTLGLPIIRTSPDHGVGFDIAGQARARPDSAIAAIRLAAAMAHKRNG
jgi:4-hydroxythreonine-4-phosphate dehydrogenase